MQLKQLLTFQAICKIGSFTEAAEQLNYTQSTVSSQIKSLELSLNAQLFSYQHRQLTLTSAGKALLPKVTQLVADYQAVLQVGEQKVQGQLTIAAPESLTITRLPAVLAAFRHRYPEVTITLQNATCEYNREILRANNADVALMLWPPFNEPDLAEVDLGQPAFSLVTGRQQAQNFGDYVHDPQATFVINEPQCSYRKWFEQYSLTKYQRTFKTMELWSIAAIKQSVAAGLGFSLLPTETIQAELANGELVQLNGQLPVNIHAHLLTNRDWQSPAAKAFVEVAREVWQV